MTPQIQRVTRKVTTEVEFDQITVSFDKDEVFKILSDHVRKNTTRVVIEQEVHEHVDYDHGLEAIFVTLFCKPT